MFIKPIETRAFGRRFRSRLEARWAVFFTEAGIQWEYEPEGFRLPDGNLYLPDFVLDGKLFVEVKPHLDEASTRFAEAVSRLSGLLSVCDGDAGLLLRGTPWATDETREYHADFVVPGEFLSCATFVECRGCSGIEIAMSGGQHDSSGICAIGFGKHTGSRCQEKIGCVLNDRLRGAFVAAVGSRFEYGEAPV